jgi:hypothetical protein
MEIIYMHKLLKSINKFKNKTFSM